MAFSTLVVTDLDGTLLDHHSYSWRPAENALKLLASRQIPLILCSSKTAAEMQPLHRELGLDAPFIVENGGAVYLPTGSPDPDDYEIVSLGMNRAEVLAILEQAGADDSVRYTGFSHMTVDDVCAATGLDKESAALSLNREFTEPLLWQDSEDSRNRFAQRLKKAGLETVQGGRFMHVSSGCDKGRAVKWLKHYYEEHWGTPVCVIALGDSENDVSMLEAADLPVLVRSPVKPYPEVRHQAVYKTSEYGPAGWNEAITTILETKGER